MRLRTASTYTHTSTANQPLAPGCPGETTKEAGDTIEVAGDTITFVAPGTPGTHGARDGTGSMRLRTASTYTHTPTATPPLAPGCPGETTKEAGDTIEVAGDTIPPSCRGHPVPMGHGTGRGQCDCGPPQRTHIPPLPPHHWHRVAPVRRLKQAGNYDRSGRRYDPHVQPWTPCKTSQDNRPTPTLAILVPVATPAFRS